MRRHWWRLFKRVAELEEEVKDLRWDMDGAAWVRVGKREILGMRPRPCMPVGEVLEAVVEALGLEIEVEPSGEARVRVRRREEEKRDV